MDNLDIFEYTSQFLSFKDKLTLMKTCQQYYTWSKYIFKNEILLFVIKSRK
jgi:hypothetical protein